MYPSSPFAHRFPFPLLRWVLACLAVALLLGACGGGTTTAEESAPAVATAAPTDTGSTNAESATAIPVATEPPTAIPVIAPATTAAEPAAAEPIAPTDTGDTGGAAEFDEPSFPDEIPTSSASSAATNATATPAKGPSCGRLNPPINTIAAETPALTNRQAELAFIERNAVGISDIYELSGLALADDGQSLWTVSDRGLKIFQVNLAGQVICELPAPTDDLEGIAIDPSGEFLYVVHEKLAEIYKLDIRNGDVITSVRLPDLEGYAPSASEVEHGGDNKSLEGIAPANGNIYLLKEGDPGLIMEVSGDLTTFLGYRMLHGPNGFIDDQVPSDKIDYAGLSYDPTRDAFWIVSDRGRRLFLYSWKDNVVLADPELRFAPEQGSGTVEKAEGLAFDIAARRFYMMAERENRIYVFDLLG